MDGSLAFYTFILEILISFFNLKIGFFAKLFASSHMSSVCFASGVPATLPTALPLQRWPQSPVSQGDLGTATTHSSPGLFWSSIKVVFYRAPRHSCLPQGIPACPKAFLPSPRHSSGCVCYPCQPEAAQESSAASAAPLGTEQRGLGRLSIAWSTCCGWCNPKMGLCLFQKILRELQSVQRCRINTCLTTWLPTQPMSISGLSQPFWSFSLHITDKCIAN